MNFPFILLLASSSLAYIIHFEKVTVPSKIKLIDGAESTFLYVDVNDTIHRMEFIETDLHEMYPIPCSFDVKRLELKNRKAKKFGNGYYLASGKNDLFLISLINATHTSTLTSSTD